MKSTKFIIIILMLFSFTKSFSYRIPYSYPSTSFPSGTVFPYLGNPSDVMDLSVLACEGYDLIWGDYFIYHSYSQSTPSQYNTTEMSYEVGTLYVYSFTGSRASFALIGGVSLYSSGATVSSRSYDVNFECVVPCDAGLIRNIEGTCVSESQCPEFQQDAVEACQLQFPDFNLEYECVYDDLTGSSTSTVNNCSEATCPVDQHFENGICVDDTCPVNQHFENGICVDDRECLEGFHYNDGSCIPDESCPLSQHIENGICVDDNTCPVSQHIENGICVDDNICPVSQHIENGICIDDEEPVVCDSGEHLENQICVDDEIDDNCPTGEHLDNGVCVVDEVPGDGDGDGEVDTCVDGEHMENGICVGDETCSEGNHLENGSCVSDEQCLVSQHLENGICVDDGSCPDGQSLENGICVDSEIPQECEEGKTLVNNECIDEGGDVITAEWDKITALKTELSTILGGLNGLDIGSVNVQCLGQAVIPFSALGKSMSFDLSFFETLKPYFSVFFGILLMFIIFKFYLFLVFKILELL